jgi:hypothetical protein
MGVSGTATTIRPAATPRSNESYWLPKLTRNKERGCGKRRGSKNVFLRATVSSKVTSGSCSLKNDAPQTVISDIHQIAAGSFANLPRFRVLGNPAPLARAVDGDGTSRRYAER